MKPLPANISLAEFLKWEGAQSDRYDEIEQLQLAMMLLNCWRPTLSM